MAKNDIGKLREWTNAKRKDPAYRAKERAKNRARLAQLKADAEYGRKCRKIIEGLMALLELVKDDAKSEACESKIKED